MVKRADSLLVKLSKGNKLVNDLQATYVKGL